MVRTVCVALLFGHPAAFAGSWDKEADADWGKSPDPTSGGITAGKRLSVTDPIVVGDLALYPVIDREADGRLDVDVTTLGPAMSTGLVSVHESSNGIVGEVRMVNHGEEPVMVMAGDVVHGGMQDRVVQRSALIAAGRAIRIPVHCVERGRWTDRFDGTFAYAGRVDPQLRGVVNEGSQDATWNAVAAGNRARGVSESASWLVGRDLDPGVLAAAERELRERFDDDKRVVGVVVARNGRFTGSDVYPHPDLFARDALQVLSSHLVAPVPTRAVAVASLPSTMDAAAFLEDQLTE